jgi:hypothetical protein
MAQVSSMIDTSGRLRPDYHGASLVNLMTSVATACGADLAGSRYPPLAALSREALAVDRPLVLLLVDGMGLRQLEAISGGHLRAHLVGRMTSVFPATTASAITTVMTGVAPQQHGLTGWYVRFRELGDVAAPLPFRLRAGWRDLQEAGVPAAALFFDQPLFPRLAVPVELVHPRDIAHSHYSRHHAPGAERTAVASLDELFEALARAVRRSGRRFVYAYWPGFDACAHAHGWSAERTLEHLERIDAAFGRLLDQAAGSGATLIATADHGFIDVEPGASIDLATVGGLAGCLAGPLTGEPRTVFCHVARGREAEFEDLAHSLLGHVCDVHRSSALIDDGLFGLGRPHPELAHRVGDFTLLMRGRSVLFDRVPGEEPGFGQIGVHGGLSVDEMAIPLVLART